MGGGGAGSGSSEGEKEKKEKEDKEKEEKEKKEKEEKEKEEKEEKGDGKNKSGKGTGMVVGPDGDFDLKDVEGRSKKDVDGKDQKVDGKDQKDVDGSLITGDVVSYGGIEVEGVVSKGKPFEYDVEGYKVSVKKGSVYSSFGAEFEFEFLDLGISDGRLRVETDYEIIERGFGEDYLVDKIKEVEIDLGDLGIEASEGSLMVELNYMGVVLAKVSKKIFVISNLVNESLVVEDLMNWSFENQTVLTKQYKAVINRPVKWIKKLKMKGEKDLQVVVPKGAMNVSVLTGTEAEEALIEAESSGEVGDEIDSNSLITGDVTLYIKEKEEKGILAKVLEWIGKKIKKIFGGNISGDVVLGEEVLVGDDEILERVDDRIVDVGGVVDKIESWTGGDVTDVVVEYYTEAPLANESLLSDESGEKRVVVYAPDELNYSDVLAYTLVDGMNISVNDSRLKVYWYASREDAVALGYLDVGVNESGVLGEDGNWLVDAVVDFAEGIVGGDVKDAGASQGDGQQVMGDRAEGNMSVEKKEKEKKEKGKRWEEKENKEERRGGKGLITGRVVGDLVNDSVGIVEEGLNLEERVSELLDLDVTPCLGDLSLVRIAVDYVGHDLDGDGFVDYVEWIVPHLSEQIYEIIYISGAEHLDENRTFVSDIYEEVREQDDNWSEEIPVGHYVRVIFERNLTKDKDITIYARMKGNNSVMINGTEIPYDVYEKKKRIEEIRRLLGE